jgi:hypothetical protein
VCSTGMQPAASAHARTAARPIARDDFMATSCRAEGARCVPAAEPRRADARAPGASSSYNVHGVFGADAGVGLAALERRAIRAKGDG